MTNEDIKKAMTDLHSIIKLAREGYITLLMHEKLSDVEEFSEAGATRKLYMNIVFKDKEHISAEIDPSQGVMIARAMKKYPQIMADYYEHNRPKLSVTNKVKIHASHFMFNNLRNFEKLLSKEIEARSKKEKEERILAKRVLMHMPTTGAAH